MSKYDSHTFNLISFFEKQDLMKWQNRSMYPASTVVQEEQHILEKRHLNRNYTFLVKHGLTQMQQGNMLKFVIVCVVVNVIEIIKRLNVRKKC